MSEWGVCMQVWSPAAFQVQKGCEASARRDQFLQRVAFQYRKKRFEGLSQYRSQHAGVRDRTLRRAGVEALYQRHVLLRPTDDLSQIDLARRSREPDAAPFAADGFDVAHTTEQIGRASCRERGCQYV